MEICTFARPASAPLTNAGLDIGVVSLDMLLSRSASTISALRSALSASSLGGQRVAQPVQVIADNATNSFGADRSRHFRKTDRRRFLPCQTPLGPDNEVGSLRHSNIAARLVASGIDADDVEPSERHVQEYADRKCNFLNITTAIVLGQGGEQPADGANRSTPTNVPPPPLERHRAECG